MQREPTLCLPVHDRGQCSTPSAQEDKKRCAGDRHKKWHKKLTVGKNCGCCLSYLHAAPGHSLKRTQHDGSLVQGLRFALPFLAGLALLIALVATDEARTTSFGSRRMCRGCGAVPFAMRSSASLPASSPS